MDKELQFQERVNRIVTTINHTEPDYVPIMGEIETWAIRYAGKTSKEVLGKPEEEFKCFAKVYSDIYYDCMMMAFLTRNVYMYEPLLNSPYFYSADNITVQHKECCYMTREDYPAFIEDPMKFTVQEYYKRKYPIFSKPYPESYEGLKKAMFSFLGFIEKAQQSAEYYRKNIGMPGIMSVTGVMPFDMILDSYRGLMPGLTDVRKCPDQLAAATEALVPVVLDNILKGREELEDFPLIFFPLDCASYLSAKQFEKLYWPTFIKILTKLHDMGGKVLLATPGKWTHLYSFLNQLPKNFAACMVDKDDIFEMKKAVGDNVTLIGGLTPDILRCPDMDVCKDYCKKLIDECAPGGGFMVTESTMLLAPDDCVLETYKEMHSFIHEYGKYK